MLSKGDQVSKTNRVIPEQLAILPVRDTVLFPGAVMPLPVGRESSLALLNSLEGPEKLLAVVAQLDPRIEVPTGSDLHGVGTLARVHKMVRMPNGNIVAFLEGLERIRVVEVVSLKPFLRGAGGSTAGPGKPARRGIDGARAKRAGIVSRSGDAFTATI